jgi:F-type H+-transporting ATPase subunit b
MLKTRRDKIAEGLQASAESQKRLAEIKDQEKAILLKAEQTALTIASEAEVTVKQEEARMLDDAHKKADQIVLSGQKRLQEDSAKIQEELIKEAKQLIRQGVGKVIRKSDVDGVLIDEALHELRGTLKHKQA